MKNLKESRSILSLLSAVTLVLLALLVLDFYHIRTQNKKTSDMLNLANKAREDESLAQSVRLLQNTAGEDVEALGDLGLTPRRLVETIESIENAGRSLGLDTEIISVDKIERPDPSDPQQIVIVIENIGPWAGSFAFLQAMESMPNRVVMKEASFNKEETGWRSGITLSLYSFDSDE